MSNFSSPETPSNEFVIPSDDWSLVTKVALASLSSQVTLMMPLMVTVTNNNTVSRARWAGCWWAGCCSRRWGGA